MAGTWATVGSSGGPSNAGTMLLLTDGSVLCHDEPNSGAVSGSIRWYRLAPDSNGHYETGTWTRLADGPNSPLYFACAVLHDGRVFIAGGEYNGTSTPVELLAAEIYDPVTNAWTPIGTPAGWTQIGDAPSAVLPDGRVLLGDIGSKRSAIYDPVADTWTAVGSSKDDPRGTEETWVLLPDQTVLALECDNQPKAEKYVIAADKWVSAGSTPVTLVDAPSDEIGSALALPDGRAFCIGATDKTALYTPPPVANQVGTWAAGPSFPTIVAGKTTGAKDAPAALLPNGRVLCLVGPYNSAAGEWGNPVYFYEYDPTPNTLTQVPAASNNGGSPFSSRLILLPTGQVLHTNGTGTVAIYTPDGAPDPAWRPSITSVPHALHPGWTYTLSGRQLNGLSQAVIYGDEGAMATNYPIVQLTNVSTGAVTYCRTHDHSTMGIQTGAVVHSTKFDVPSGAALGAWQLRVIANGIASEPASVSVTTKRWKELKLEIKETKELIKLEHEKFKLVFEDLRKINELDWRERFIPDDWSEVVKQLVQRSDELETEARSLRSFITKEERPEVGSPTKVERQVAAERVDDGAPIEEMRPPKPPKKKARAGKGSGRARGTR
jgi:Kelch motif